MTWIHEGPEWFIRCDYKDCGKTTGPGMPATSSWRHVHSAVAKTTTHWCPTHAEEVWSDPPF